MADLPSGKNSITYTGAAQTFTVATGGDLKFKLWGGGGSGGNASNLTPREGYGGAGGFVTGEFSVAPGDTIKVEVGGGGVTNALTGAMGTGGWPDGGPGSYAFTIRSAGSGGGSTRLYVNNVLIAVAGAGGGGCLNEGPNGLGYGGAGGGATGQSGTGSWYASGGSQTEGGRIVNRAPDPLQVGAYLKGGSGAITSGTGTGTSNDGAGGGGGYYGGGGSAGLWGATVSSGAGGGSSYTHPTAAKASTTAGVGKAAPKTDDPDYVAGVARGSDQGSTGVMALPGGNGLAVLEIAAVLPPPDLPQGKTTVSYTGESKSYKATRPGYLTAKLWGGGGAAGYNTSPYNTIAGKGAYVTGTWVIQTGDIVRVDTAQGGQPTTSPTAPGLGGWPDGGKAGIVSATVHGGAGGGSSRIFINGVLMAVAGGGGGSGQGGWAGGSAGYPSGQGSMAASSATGGTQTAGGTHPSYPTDASVSGGYLRGGNGYTVSGAPPAVNQPGSGGGGGYYGGGGGTVGAGGGSSYYHTSTLYPLVANVFNVGNTGSAPDDAPEKTDSDYVPGVATPGVMSTSAPLRAAGDGLVVLTFADSPDVSVSEQGFNYVGPTTQTWTAPGTGKVHIDLWGAGSGGSVSLTTPMHGGSGGHIAFSRTVVAGDVFTFEIAQGGLPPKTGFGGPGGWPDGGTGARASATAGWAGGGGSSRVYLNGVLLGVAAGGGGGGNGASANKGGAGGGENGVNGGTSTAATYVPGLGGSQTAGGTNALAPTDTSMSGGYLRGGNGFLAVNDSAFIGKSTGPGGGGGYYGGAGGAESASNSNAATAAGAGGGSSYAPANATNAAGIETVPNGTDLPWMPADVARPGGIGTVLDAPTSVGKHGFAWLRFEAPPVEGAPEEVSLAPGNNIYPSIRKTREIVVTQAGIAMIHLWGGGGSGPAMGGPRKGGDGGYVTFQLEVEVGDRLLLAVGQGGQAATARSGGMGGWPDGGSGGRRSATLGWGGGGGSTRLWKNGVLYAVAGGGGGGGGGTQGAAAPLGGHGGGQDAASTAYPNLFYPGTGGTSSAGGSNSRFPSDPELNGSAARGGNGYQTGSDSLCTGLDGVGVNTGPGGGGGYYGGGAGMGGTTAQLAGGGGGGSHLVPAGGSSTIGLSGTGVPGYVTPVGVGSAGGATVAAATSGGDGLAVIQFIVPRTLVDGQKDVLRPTQLAEIYKVPAAGLLTFKAWAGGGGGARRAPSTPAYGGAGAFMSGQLRVKAGDTVSIEVGGGGQAASTTATVAGAGGWPDGGQGGKYEAAGTNLAGSGGGSTRLYLNGVLVGVVGAGGGSCSWYSTTVTGDGGAGGVRRGQAGSGHNSYVGTGGADRGGGICRQRSTNPNTSGAYLKGGAGYSTTPDTADGTAAGPGGGGGYYGGGAGSGLATTSAGGAGGGTSYASTLIANLRMLPADGKTPPASNDPDYPAGAAVGGAQGSPTTVQSGGDGCVVVEFLQGADLAPLELGKTVFEADQARSYDFVAAEDGSIAFKLWGGAGAPQTINTTLGLDPAYSGPGGYTTGIYSFTAGSVIRVAVGEGGGAPQATMGGEGGWPDGGHGGFISPNACGGGGGSTRLYVNNHLVAIAGGGGGSGAGTTRQGGFGGGLSGGDGAGSNTYRGLGGSQTAGGVGFNNSPYRNGDAFLGGDGHDPVLPWTMAGAAASGSGGGGGYYGGAGGAGATANASGAGGGSGYLDPNVIQGTYVTSATRIAPEASNNDYLPGVAEGVVGLTTVNTETQVGGPGLAVLTYTAGAISIPGEAYGVVGEVALAPPQGTAVGAHDVQKPLPGPILLTSTQGGVVVAGPPTGEALPPIIVEPVLPDAMMNGNAQGEIGTILMEMNLVAGPTTEALIQVPLVDYNLVLTPPEGIGAGSINIITPFPGLIRTTAPRASINGYTTIEPFEHDLVLTAPEAIADQGTLFELVFPGPILMETPEPAVSAGANFTPPHFGEPPNAYYGLVRTSPVEGFVRSADMDTIVDLPGPITVSQIDGFAMEGVDAFAESLPDINLTMFVEATAVGNANAYPDKPSSQPYLALVQMLPTIQAEVTGEVDFHTPEETIAVRVNPIEGMTEYAATILASILPAVIELRSPAGLGGLEIDGLGAGEEFPVIRVGEPHAYVDSDTPGFAPLRYWRSSVPTRAPAELEEREIALNEADGVLFTRDAQGDVRPTALAAISRGASVPDAGEEGDMLRGDGVWGLMLPLYDDAIRLEPPAEARIFLAEDVLQRESASPMGGEVTFQPFFIPRPTRISELSITVVTPAAGQAHLGLARWSLTGRTEGYLATGAVSLASGGLKSLPVDLMLRTGWYVAVLGMTASAQLSGVRVASQVDVNTFQPIGALACPLEGDLATLIQPMARAASNHAFITARVS
ncbi:putative lectin-like domain protein [Brevundimonas phage vB_BpoS-Kikimora]|uniref:receptor protein-tyrosine kinase n=1 Tax=Brevundimonas phage vB_BpoS-Kikimora TaxID=2948601 RepID=A0A9E7SKH1_9CAUD|nr:putative lectin-like domain protein [Brevundimonas phage vB_BpoS-Kikimora]